MCADYFSVVRKILKEANSTFTKEKKISSLPFKCTKNCWEGEVTRGNIIPKKFGCQQKIKLRQFKAHYAVSGSAWCASLSTIASQKSSWRSPIFSMANLAGSWHSTKKIPFGYKNLFFAVRQELLQYCTLYIQYCILYRSNVQGNCVGVQCCGGLMVSALDSGSRGPGSIPGRIIVLCSWARHFTLTMPLSTQEYK